MGAELGSLLKKRREELGLTLREVQERSGVSNAYLSQIENDKVAQPTPGTLQKLADIYDIAYSKLLGLAGHPVEFGPTTVVQFRTGSGIEELSEVEEKELLNYLRYLRSKGKE